MRKAIVLTALAASVCLLGGCDFFRQLAGRPTSEDIEAKRLRIEQEVAEHQRRLDSLQAVEKQVSDSLATLDSLRADKQTLISSKQLASGGKYSLPYRYYVVVGSFGYPDNARRQAARVEDAGFAATLIPFKNGFTSVGICPSNSLNEVYASLKKLRSEPFCPVDAWILKNE